jgi:glycosyltransferase 2 family protein
LRRTALVSGRLAIGGAILAVLVWRLGAGPFLDGVRTVNAPALSAAAGLAVVTTLCCAWRWRIVARGLGIDLPLGAAVASYYRSLFLNVALPGGVAGDVHRGISHGRHLHDVGLGLRAVVWERSAGQGVQVVLTAALLLALPSPVQSVMPLVAVAVVAATVGVVVAIRALARRGRIRLLLSRRGWSGVAVASAVVVVGHAVMFMIAARTTGTPASASRMLPLALLVMLAMVLPNVAGWGPREGAAALVFAAAGLGAEAGVATAVVYGVMSFVASLPGAVVLVLAWFRRTRLPDQPVRLDGSVHA